MDRLDKGALELLCDMLDVRSLVALGSCNRRLRRLVQGAARTWC